MGSRSAIINASDRRPSNTLAHRASYTHDSESTYAVSTKSSVEGRSPLSQSAPPREIRFADEDGDIAGPAGRKSMSSIYRHEGQ